MVLKEKRDNGEVETFFRERNEWLDALPPKECWSCEGTGKDKKDGTVCAGCNGVGTRDQSEKTYRINSYSVNKWIAFLNTCGGFRIW